MNHRFRPQRNQRGTALVEFAMVLPLAFALLLGIFTGGVAYSNKIGLVEAVREGARFGASLPMGSGAGAVTTWETQVKNRVVAASGGDVAFADICVKFVLPTGGTDCGLADPPGASNEPTIHLVKVSAVRSATLEFFFFTSQKVMQGKLVARFERDTG